MANNKYHKGLKIRIKHDVSPTGKYGHVAGKTGVITSTNNWGDDIMITMDDTGEKFRYVGKSVLEKASKNADRLTNDADDITREALEERKEKLEKALKRINAKLEFLDATDSNIFSEKLYRAHKIMKLASSGKEADQNEVAKIIADLL